MNLKNKLKPHKEVNIEEYHNCKILKKIYDKEYKNFIYKSTDAFIKKSSGYIKICYIKKNRKIPLFKFCLKHSCFSRVTDNTIPRIDSCRIFGDPFIQDTLISFPNPGIANEYEIKVKKEWECQKSSYANLSYFVVVTNEIIETIKKSATVCISGLTTGHELKLWIEKEFNFSEIYMEKYVLVMKVGKNSKIIKEDTSLLILYEHLSNRGTRNFCSKDCGLKSAVPESAVHININLNVTENSEDKDTGTLDVYYCIEEKWGADMMPNWLMRLLSDLYYNGPLHEGVFRLCGKDSLLGQWYKRMLNYDDFIITENIYNKAAILKYFIRNIKGSLMTKKYKKEFNNISKKFMKMSAEKYLENDKKKEKLIRLILQLPKTHLFLLQNLLVVIEALTESSKTLLKPFSIARSISASIFPLLPLSLWKYGAKMFEAIILLTNKLVSESVRSTIIVNYIKFREQSMPVDNVNNICHVNSITDYSCSDSFSSNTGADCKTEELYIKEETDLSDYELYLSSSDQGSISDVKSTSDPSLIDFEIRSSMKSEFPIDLGTRHKIFLNDVIMEKNENSMTVVSSSENLSNVELLKTSENSCEEMKDTYCSPERSSNLTQFVKSVDLKTEENEDFIEKSNVGVRHKSLLRPNKSLCKDINRTASTIIRSPTDLNNRFINEGSQIDKVSKTDIYRKHSRKTMSTVQETHSYSELNHRSRSPNVKSLIKLYEEKNKVLSSEDSSGVENCQIKIGNANRKKDRHSIYKI